MQGQGGTGQVAGGISSRESGKAASWLPGLPGITEPNLTKDNRDVDGSRQRNGFQLVPGVPIPGKKGYG